MNSSQPRPASSYLASQVIGSEDLSRRTSIMFEEGRHLSISGAPGMVRTELIQIVGRGISLGRVMSTGHEIALKDIGNFTVLLPSAGRLDIQICGQEYRSVPGRPLLIRPTERRTRASPMLAERFRATTLQVSSRRLLELARSRPLSMNAAFPRDAMHLSGAIGQYIAGQLPQLLDSILVRPTAELPHKVADLIASLVDDHFCELLGGAVDNTSSHKIIPAFHRVRQAEEIMHAHSDDPLAVHEIARRLGVSLRSLQLAFAEVYDGLSPRSVLNRIRLEKARSRLLAADVETHVTAVALNSGIFHLGRFSQAYARTFGEKPSETLRRRRA